MGKIQKKRHEEAWSQQAVWDLLCRVPSYRDHWNRLAGANSTLEVIKHDNQSRKLFGRVALAMVNPSYRGEEYLHLDQYITLNPAKAVSCDFDNGILGETNVQLSLVLDLRFEDSLIVNQAIEATKLYLSVSRKDVCEPIKFFSRSQRWSLFEEYIRAHDLKESGMTYRQISEEIAPSTDRKNPKWAAARVRGFGKLISDFEREIVSLRK